jgi:hypothetical protein
VLSVLGLWLWNLSPLLTIAVAAVIAVAVVSAVIHHFRQKRADELFAERWSADVRRRAELQYEEADSSNLKGRLGGVHVQKIRMADEVYIVDPGGYVGESTRREIAYAESLGKPVRYLSREPLARTGDGPHE